LKFLIDDALSPLIAAGLQAAGHDAVHVRDRQMQSASDSDIFAFAAGEDRALISADTDFATLLALRGEVKPSVVVFRRGPKKPAIQLQLLLDNLSSLEDLVMLGSIIVIEKNRIRVRRLPIGI
jgi:predicted nuclease of predicted toxin-antitoxin system